MEENKLTVPPLIQWGIFPALFALIPLAGFAAKSMGLALAAVYGPLVFGTLLIMLVLEFLFPARAKWRMTKRSFLRRDLKYFLLSMPILGLVKYAAGALGILLAGRTGPFENWPVWAAVPAGLIVIEFFQYWYHRLSHEASGPAGRFLWRVHSTHHLPNRVYLLMHPVGHPLNALVTFGIINTGLVLGGFSGEAIFYMNAISALVGNMSHFNVNARIGPLNYVFTGAETHRYHHSAKITEAKNYGAVLVLWDLIFGTFYYRPGELPVRLGVDEPKMYPAAQDVWDVIKFPFRASAKSARIP